jgi:phosphatidylglycerophosphate synthase
MTTSIDQVPITRRQLASRDTRVARMLARRLATLGVTPNAISLAGVGFAILSAAAFFAAGVVVSNARAAVLLVAAAAIQLRLLCNLLDGMLAVEEGLKSATGDLFNELPDRAADIVVLVGAGYAATTVTHGELLGWLAALLAVGTAFVRVFAGSLGLTQHFIGPMAKQHRMFTLTMFTLLAAAEAAAGLPPRAISAGLALVVAGSGATVVRRTSRLAQEARAR